MWRSRHGQVKGTQLDRDSNSKIPRTTEPSSFIRSPLSQLDALIVAGGGASAIPERSAHALGISADDASWDHIPLITRRGYANGTLAPCSLVRWVGMVQDTAEPEYFPAQYVETSGAEASGEPPVAATTAAMMTRAGDGCATSDGGVTT